jgi:hypothetical protein
VHVKKIVLPALLLLASIPASASIALFSDGRTMKIDSFKLVSDSDIELKFKSGGAMTIPLTRIDRIVDDEIAPAAVIAEVKKIVQEEGGIFPKRSWRYDAKRGPIFRSKYDSVIVEAAKKFDVDAALVSAVIKAESDFNPREYSNKGAQGLMQLMPGTAVRFGVTNAWDPVANIYGGVRYLRWLLQTFDDNADFAVAAYNAGEGNVWKYNGVPPFRETINYVNRIAKHIRQRTTEPQPPATEVASASSDR